MKRRKTALMMLSVLMVLAIFYQPARDQNRATAARKNQQANRSKAGIWLLVQSERQHFSTHYIQQMNQVQILNK